MHRISVILLALILIALTASAVAAERILGFHSDITVHPDSSMTVRETIAVQAEGRKIKRGIYRDFPTTYQDHLGNRYTVGFEILGVERNGRREDYHTSQLSNGIRIYFGHKNRFLSRGQHEYLLTYRTRRQLGYFDTHDELYWNVTGNGWDFRIDSASASVTLPDSVPSSSIRVEGYTGTFGDKGQDYHATVENGRAEFDTTRPLNSHEGLTIVTMWPKGHVKQPATEDELRYLLQDNRHLAYMLGGLVLVFMYYLVVWVRVGRDQPEGVIVPLYFPPKGFSPASMRFIRRRNYDNKTFATALVNLAVKGAVAIDESGGEFTVERKYDVKGGEFAAGVEKAPGESVLLKSLLGSRKKIDLEQSNHATISSAIDAHKKSLKRDYEKIYFVRNSGWIVPGVLLSLATYLTGLFNSPVESIAPAIFLSVWLSIWSVAVYALVIAAARAFRNARGVTGFIGFLRALIFAGVFGFFEIAGIWMFVQFASALVILMLLAMTGVNVVFYHLLHADTRAGRQLIDKVEGFRQYLEVAEGDELKFRGAPTKTTDLFEMYLPYALALDVEQQWAERFASVFAALEREGKAYQPGWYSGSRWHHHNVTSFADSIGSSLGAAVSSSSTAPGSSSGGGGGGSSGGGGGGGGGGGW